VIKLETILVETSKLLGISSRLEDEKIIECWGSVVGEEQSNHTKALYFKRGILYVDTTSPSWTHRLTINKKIFIEELNKIASKTVKDIRFSSTGSISVRDSNNE